MLVVGNLRNSNSHSQPHQIRRHSPASLRRGDCVMAVNRRPVRDFGGGSLQDVTAYMRRCVALHLAVWRIPSRNSTAATTAAIPVTGRLSQSHAAGQQRDGWQPQQPTASQSYPFYAPLTGRSPSGAQSSPEAPFQYGMPPRPCYYTPSTPVMIAGSSTWKKPVVVTPPSAVRTVTTTTTTSQTRCHTGPPWADPYTNPLFRDAGGRPIPYDDNWEPDDVDEGQRWRLFLAPVGPSFHEWLSRRKSTWRATWDATKPVRDLVADSSVDDNNSSDDFASGVVDGSNDRRSSTVPVDFWSPQGYASLDRWLHASKQKWAKRYSWNQRKRKHFETDARVSLDDDVGAWLEVRKRQWLMSRRKRQRQRQQLQFKRDSSSAASQSVDLPSALNGDEDQFLTGGGETPSQSATAGILATTHSINRDILLIDELLEEEERRRKALEDRPPLDLSFLFEEGVCPDDTVVHVLGYLDPKEHGKLLCIRRQWRQSLIRREGVWRDLCPTRWTLPRRPRKPWHELYLTNLRREKESSQKRWDDLLAKLSRILEKGDYVQQVEKLVDEAERSFGFHINYSSGVVCERNAILNLAVIQKRHKIARWLVEVKNADIETFDRGHFTPLLNAAWGGDKYMVRFLLQHGADRSKVGFYHYTKPLSSPDFEGLNAADWADKKGYEDIATLIRMGL